ncbi:MAG TPA: PSP1 C-terminal domain-containing protein, partial [Candidatus Limnocylindria bacterium]|nr:PSP1 C-terminal domain-containing protein [Candidatus Limnocylindria bacterium]
MRTVVGARFMKAGRMYFFDPGPLTEFRVNDWIIVRTELGIDAARVQILPTDSPLVQVDPPLGTVVRKATVTDVLEINKRERMDADASLVAAEMTRARGLPIKILGADWQFDGSALTIFYSTDPSGRGPVDAELAELNAAYAAHFGTRIELRRLGARDETKVMTG